MNHPQVHNRKTSLSATQQEHHTHFAYRPESYFRFISRTANKTNFAIVAQTRQCYFFKPNPHRIEYLQFSVTGCVGVTCILRNPNGFIQDCDIQLYTCLSCIIKQGWDNFHLDLFTVLLVLSFNLNTLLLHLLYLSFCAKKWMSTYIVRGISAFIYSCVLLLQHLSMSLYLTCIDVDVSTVHIRIWVFKDFIN